MQPLRLRPHCSANAQARRDGKPATNYTATTIGVASHYQCGLTLEFTRLRKRAKPAVAGRLQRMVGVVLALASAAKLVRDGLRIVCDLLPEVS